jgi:hypothetical protein
MNKYILTILMLFGFSVNVNVMAVDSNGYDSCKLEPAKANETYCNIYIEEGKVVVLVGATTSAVPYLNGHKLTVTEFNSIDKKGEDNIYVEGGYEDNIVTISKFDN